jgi:DNA-binding NarL/FixJ family response regulator
MERIRVVLADDHTLFREGTRELLERDGQVEVVGEAADGTTTVELVDTLLPDIAIVDVEMPGADGIEVTRTVKERHPGIGVLVLTVHDEDPFVFAILEAGAAGYLLKDVHGSELVRTVRALASGESVLHPTIAHKVLQRLRTASDAPPVEAPAPLPDRDVEVLRLAARGRTNAQIADDLGVSVRTVQLRLTNVFSQLQVGSRTEAVIAGLRAGILQLDELVP